MTFAAAEGSLPEFSFDHAGWLYHCCFKGINGIPLLWIVAFNYGLA
jgi:hypothetical protein